MHTWKPPRSSPEGAVGWWGWSNCRGLPASYELQLPRDALPLPGLFWQAVRMRSVEVRPALQMGRFAVCWRRRILGQQTCTPGRLRGRALRAAWAAVSRWFLLLASDYATCVPYVQPGRGRRHNKSPHASFSVCRARSCARLRDLATSTGVLRLARSSRRVFDSATPCGRTRRCGISRLARRPKRRLLRPTRR